MPAWTVQPAGTRFDPPIEVTLPNSAGNAPGDNLPIVQWDHDLGQFVPMGRVTVSEDGAFLISDAGSGLTKAGWGGLCRYDPDKCAKNKPPKCDMCQMLDTSGTCPTCKADPSKDENLTGPVQAIQLEFEGQFLKGITDIFNKFQEAPLNPLSLSLKIKGKITGKNQEECCSRSPSGREKRKLLSGTVEAEVELKVAPPWAKLLNVAGENFGLAELNLLSIKVKGFGGVGGTVESNGCRNEFHGTVHLSTGITGELVVASIKVPFSNPTYTLEAIAGVTMARTCKFDVVSKELLKGKCPWSTTLYIKADWKTPAMKFTMINVALPLDGSTVGTLDY